MILYRLIKHGWGGGVDQRTDDAYVRADMTPLSTRVSGTVRKVEVEDFAAVKPGQLLVQLDDEDYRAVLEEANAALARAVLGGIAVGTCSTLLFVPFLYAVLRRGEVRPLEDYV